MFMGLILAAGMWWMMQPMPNALPSATPSPEVRYAPWGIACGLALTVISAAVLIRRYLLVRRILSEGSLIRGTVELAERFDTNARSNKGTIQTSTTYVYCVTIRYAVHGIEHTIRRKLPHSFGAYGIKQGGGVDLLVLDDLPRQALIREVYLGRTAT